MRTILVLALFGTLAATGCAKPAQLTIDNPLVSGVSEPNQIRNARRNQPPISVTIAAASPTEICFDVTYTRTDRDDLPSDQPHTQNMMLRGDNGWTRPVEYRNTRREMTSRQGTKTVQVKNGERTRCLAFNVLGQCVQTETEPTYEHQRVGSVQLTSRVWTRACFDNRGQLTPETDRLRFRIHRLDFIWALRTGAELAAVRR